MCLDPPLSAARNSRLRPHRWLQQQLRVARHWGSGSCLCYDLRQSGTCLNVNFNVVQVRHRPLGPIVPLNQRLHCFNRIFDIDT